MVEGAFGGLRRPAESGMMEEYSWKNKKKGVWIIGWIWLFLLTFGSFLRRMWQWNFLGGGSWTERSQIPWWCLERPPWRRREVIHQGRGGLVHSQIWPSAANFITKTRRAAGWDGERGNLQEVAPGMSIGGTVYEL
ncbi:MAG: hypothetical protein ACLTMW_02740 [Blautia hydrogenotrophica]